MVTCANFWYTKFIYIVLLKICIKCNGTQANGFRHVQSKRIAVCNIHLRICHLTFVLIQTHAMSFGCFQSNIIQTLSRKVLLQPLVPKVDLKLCTGHNMSSTQSLEVIGMLS